MGATIAPMGAKDGVPTVSAGDHHQVRRRQGRWWAAVVLLLGAGVVSLELWEHPLALAAEHPADRGRRAALARGHLAISGALGVMATLAVFGLQQLI
jgi:hypothetical protein